MAISCSRLVGFRGVCRLGLVLSIWAGLAMPVRAQVEDLNPLTDQQREIFYNRSEGSIMAPAWLYENLPAYDSRTGLPMGKRFPELIGRYGYLFETADSELPIGFSVINPDHVAGVPWLGITCSGCHVTELHHTTASGTARLRINGGPNMVDNRWFTDDFYFSLEQALQNPRQLLELFLRAGRLSAQSQEYFRSISLLAPSDEGSGYASNSSTAEGDAALQAVRELVLWEQQRRKHSPNRNGFEPQGAGNGSALPPSVLPDAVLLNILSDIRLLLSQLEFLGNFFDLNIKTREGFGRLDAFGTARVVLYPDLASGFELHAPAAISHLWGTGQIKWLHWNANTNSTLQRNIGQALGIGAQQVSGGATSVLLPNLHDLETVSQSIVAPNWPEHVFGAIDPTLANQGAALYAARCAHCHESPTMDRNGLLDFPMFSLNEIGTDPNHALEFHELVGNQSYPDRLLKTLTDIERWYYYRRDIRHRVSRGTQREWAGGRARLPVVWRDPLKGNLNAPVYPGRSLKGIWATAPYLHNNAVPSIRELLRPADQRPIVFQVGHREYDPVNIGFTQDLPVNSIPDSQRFDTTLDGNSNSGHEGPEFSTDLTEEEISALLEYIKTL